MLCLLGFDQLNIFLLLFCTHIKKVVTSVQNSHYGLEKMIGILISFADFCLVLKMVCALIKDTPTLGPKEALPPWVA